MGCGTFFWQCAKAETLEGAEVLVILDTEEDQIVEGGAAFVYVGHNTGDPDNPISGEIVKMANEDLAAYRGDASWRPWELTDSGITNYRYNMLEEAMGHVEGAGNLPEAESFSRLYPESLLIDAYGPAYAFDLEQDVVGDFSNLVQAINDYDTAMIAIASREGASEMELLDAQTMALEFSIALNETLDGLKEADNMPLHRERLLAELQENSDIAPEAVHTVQAFIENGISGGGGDLDPSVTQAQVLTLGSS